MHCFFSGEKTSRAWIAASLLLAAAAPAPANAAPSGEPIWLLEAPVNPATVTRSSLASNPIAGGASGLPEYVTEGELTIPIESNTTLDLAGFDVVISGLVDYRMPHLNLTGGNWDKPSLFVVNWGNADANVSVQGSYKFQGVLTRGNEHADWRPDMIEAGVVNMGVALLVVNASRPLRSTSGETLIDAFNNRPYRGCVDFSYSGKAVARFTDAYGLTRRRPFEERAYAWKSQVACPPMPAAPPPPIGPGYFDIPMSLARDAGPTVWQVRLPPPLPRLGPGHAFSLVMRLTGIGEPSTRVSAFSTDMRIRLVAQDGRLYSSRPFRLFRYNSDAMIEGQSYFNLRMVLN